MCLSLTLYIVILQGGRHKANLRATQSEADGPVSRRGGAQGGTKLPKIIPHKQVCTRIYLFFVTPRQILRYLFSYFSTNTYIVILIRIRHVDNLYEEPQFLFVW